MINCRKSHKDTEKGLVVGLLVGTVTTLLLTSRSVRNGIRRKSTDIKEEDNKSIPDTINEKSQDAKVKVNELKNKVTDKK